MSGQQFTGLRIKDRKTRWTVKFLDRCSGALIRVGGIGTIIAVLLVCVFLIISVLPLFRSSAVRDSREIPTLDSPSSVGETPALIAADDFKSALLTFSSAGTLEARRADTGELVDSKQVFAAGSPVPTALSFNIERNQGLFGFADGTARFMQLGFRTTFIERERIPAEIAGLAPEAAANYEQGVAQLTPAGQLRVQKLFHEFSAPLQPPPGLSAPIRLIDFTQTATGPIFAAYTVDGRLWLSVSRSQKNLLTGKTSLRSSQYSIPLQPAPAPAPAAGNVAHLVQSPKGETPSSVLQPAPTQSEALNTGEFPRFLRISGLGDRVYLAWPDGTLQHYYVRNPQSPQWIETLDLVADPAQTLTALEFLIGRTTLLAGDSTGRIEAWMPAQRVRQDGAAQIGLVNIRRFPGAEAAVRAIAVSSRLRMFAAAYQNGETRIYHATSRKLLARFIGNDASDLHTVAFAPKDDALLVAGRSGITLHEFDPRHPETGFAALFLPVWYEGYPGPAHVWQSSSGTDDFEPKLGMLPLIFGTLKATLYSMLFAAPLALLAAIYVSEFMQPRLKSVVKPGLEMMASLPSVVLGFLAALVFAPFVEGRIVAILLLLLTLPLSFLLGAQLWQALPQNLYQRWAGWRLAAILGLALPLGIWGAFVSAPAVEGLLFGGDFKQWLDGRNVNFGAPAAGWLPLLLPLCAGLACWVNLRWINSWLRGKTAVWTQRQSALAELARFAANLAAVLLLAGGGALLLGRFGDARGTYLDTYTQRNALVVGFVMGFAVIPIIFTIAEDALSAVPQHLRSAALGAGATPWQTTLRIVIPTAMSGLFSAVMIGLGRAVGETMIVLMAAGNTPVLDWNVFNGFRTLSANIAVEMPEAVRNSTHYRTLFLAALILFALTFVLNTIAELVRLRFRRKALEL